MKVGSDFSHLAGKDKKLTEKKIKARLRNVVEQKRRAKHVFSLTFRHHLMSQYSYNKNLSLQN